MRILNTALWCVSIMYAMHCAYALLCINGRRLSSFAGKKIFRAPLAGTADIHNSLLREMGAPSHHSVVSSPVSHALPLGPAFLKRSAKVVLGSPVVSKLGAVTPPLLKTFLKCIHPGELLLLIVFQLSYSRLLKFAHKMQTMLWKATNFGTPNEWSSSILGFVHERSHLLSKLITFNYGAKLLCSMLANLGFNIRADFPSLLSRISYALFMAQFADMFKAQFLRSFFPKVSESKRQSYMVNKSASVIIWTVGGLVACEMVSSYLKVPLSSTLAFGGVGGLAVGLSLRDIAANFMGGMMLLFNEPFTPGDMVTFKSGKTEIVGRVERVGWGQTRIRGRDTRPTYVPNSHFAQAAVTNMERITHRKYETTVPIRFEDYSVMYQVIERIRERLRVVPKLDVLSMPFRVSFVKVGTYSLEVEITCYFATKSIDEFLSLQQMANMEVIAAIHECGASLALPTSLMQVDALRGGAAGRAGAGAARATTVHYGEAVRSAGTDEGGGDDDDAGEGDAVGRVGEGGSTRRVASALEEEMQLAEALQDLPMYDSSDGDISDSSGNGGEQIPLGSSGADRRVAVDAHAGSPASVSRPVPVGASSEGVRAQASPGRKKQSRKEGQPDYSFGVRTFGGSPAAVTSPAPVPASGDSYISTNEDAVAEAERQTDIWHESIRSAGIRTDGKKYFAQASAGTPAAPAAPIAAPAGWTEAEVEVGGERQQRHTAGLPGQPAEHQHQHQHHATGTFWEHSEHSHPSSATNDTPIDINNMHGEEL